MDRDQTTICRHYVGLAHNTVCDGGVEYSDLQTALDIKAAGVVAICMGRASGCSKYQPYTPEEIAQQEQTVKEQAGKIAIARTAIVTKTQGKRNVWGEIHPCPVCHEGMLKYSVSMWNGHIRGKCSTPTCVDWNENKEKA